MSKGTIYRAILTKHHDEEHGDMWQCLFMFTNGRQKAIDVTDVRGAANEIWMIEEAELEPYIGMDESKTTLAHRPPGEPPMVTDTDGEADGLVYDSVPPDGMLSGVAVKDAHGEGSEP